jgi:hypothetical protein
LEHHLHGKFLFLLLLRFLRHLSIVKFLVER